MKTRRFTAGFTLFEVTVTIGLILLFAAVVIPNLNQGSAQGRDAQRQADLRNIENALERYRLRHGRYPEACNGPNTWSGEVGSAYECNNNTGPYAAYVGTGQYIVGDLSSTPETEYFAGEFIASLPTDPNRDVVDGGYVYAVDANGEVFKIMALNTVENDEVTTLEDELARCGDISRPGSECSAIPNTPLGGHSHIYNTDTSGNNLFPHCNFGDSGFRNDYAISKGYASGRDLPGGATEKAREYYTDQIRCK